MAYPKQPRIIVNCAYCNKELKRTAGEIKQFTKLFFCNRDHHFKHNIKGKEWPCDNCGKLVFKAPKDIKRIKHHFCSDKCFAEYNTQKQQVACDWCSNLFIRKIDQLEKYKNKFCSKVHYDEFMRNKYADRKQKNRYKYRARSLVFEAVEKGVLIKTDCIKEDDLCKGIIEAHHYLGWELKHALDVQWLCYFHHRVEHKRLKEQGINLH
jgi:hypothetical protein